MLYCKETSKSEDNRKNLMFPLGWFVRADFDSEIEESPGHASCWAEKEKRYSRKENAKSGVSIQLLFSILGALLPGIPD